MIYTVFLFLHSFIRWVVVVSGVWTVVRAFNGRRSGAPYSEADARLRTSFVASLHFNSALGLLLYAALSPVTRAGFADFGAAMKSSAVRFFLVEHVFGMVIAVVLATIGSAKVRRSEGDEQKHTRSLVFFGVALLVLLASIPWPFLPAGRPLLRLPF